MVNSPAGTRRMGISLLSMISVGNEVGVDACVVITHEQIPNMMRRIPAVPNIRRMSIALGECFVWDICCLRTGIASAAKTYPSAGVRGKVAGSAGRVYQLCQRGCPRATSPD